MLFKVVFNQLNYINFGLVIDTYLVVFSYVNSKTNSKILFARQ